MVDLVARRPRELVLTPDAALELASAGAERAQRPGHPPRAEEERDHDDEDDEVPGAEQREHPSYRVLRAKPG
jgi:hypothetical protein